MTLYVFTGDTVPPPETGGLIIAPISFIQGGEAGAVSGQIKRNESSGYQIQSRHAMNTTQVQAFKIIWQDDLKRGTREFQFPWLIGGNGEFQFFPAGEYSCKFVSPIRLSARIPTKIRGGSPLVEVSMEYTAYNTRI